MTELETINQLTHTLTALKTQQSGVSLRLWHSEGKIKFFLTNLPKQNHRQEVRPTVKPVTNGRSLSTPHEPDPSPVLAVKQKVRGRKRRCVNALSSTQDNTQISTEQLRVMNQTDDLQPSVIEGDREDSEVNIPCSNYQSTEHKGRVLDSQNLL